MEAIAESNVRIPCMGAIKRSLCKAECCGPIPFPSEQYYQLKHLVQVEPASEIRAEDGRFVFPIADDLRCVFLNRTTYMCSIYEQRPQVCRDYGHIDELPCPCFKTSGLMRTRAERREMRRKIDRDMRAMAQRQLRKVRRKI